MEKEQIVVIHEKDGYDIYNSEDFILDVPELIELIYININRNSMPRKGDMISSSNEVYFVKLILC